MKVIQFVSRLNLNNGVATSTLELARALKIAGHESLVVSSGGGLVSTLEKNGTEHITLPIDNFQLNIFAQISAVKKVIFDYKPDIIHFRSCIPACIVKLALKTIDKKKHPILVTTVHNTYEDSLYSRRLFEVDHVICVSHFVHKHLQENFSSFDNNKSSVIYRGVDPKLYSYMYKPSVHWWNNIRAEFPELDKKIWLTIAGSITDYKGHQWLLDTIGGLQSEFPNLHAVIIGEPKEQECLYFYELQKRLKALNIDDKFTFTGAREDLREWLAASNIVLCLDDKPRSFGRNLLEAIALGTPVIAWNEGGVAEMLGQVYPTGLIEKHNALTLIDSVRYHLTKQPKPEHQDTFILKPALTAVLEVYQNLLSQKKQGSL